MFLVKSHDKINDAETKYLDSRLFITKQKNAVVIVDLRQKQKQAERKQNVLHLVKNEMAKCLKVPQ